MRALLEKTLSSRKFWAACAASGPLAATGEWYAFAAVWVGYFFAQGAVDAMAAKAGPGDTIVIDGAMIGGLEDHEIH